VAGVVFLLTLTIILAIFIGLSESNPAENELYNFDNKTASYPTAGNYH
jgi:hypothetical protein